MNDNTKLQELAYQTLRLGAMPARRPDRVWGGAAFGGCTCKLCGAVVEPGGIALEVEYVGEGEGQTRGVHLHVRCFHALTMAISRIGAAQTGADGKHSATETAAEATHRAHAHGRIPAGGLPRQTAATRIRPHGWDEGFTGGTTT